MKMGTSRRMPPKLTTSIFGYLLVGATVLAAGLAVVVPEYSRAVADRALERSVQTRTQSAALDFARALHTDWEEIKFIAQIVATQPQAQIRAKLDGVVGSGTRISWVGLAGLDGGVVSASGGLLEGVDVSARPWFAAGLRGRFAGDVRDAVLLSRLPGGTEMNPLRFIDFALPVENENGDIVGVLASHTTFEWVERFLTESAAVREIDLYLVDVGGAVVFATDSVPTDPRSLQSLRAAATGVAAQTREVWPDGREYFAMTVPSVSYADLPNFGWRLVGRVPGNAYESDMLELQGTLTAIAIGAGLIFAAYAAMFAFAFLRPLVNLVDNAERVAAGEQVYPRESRSSAEAMRLSWALARIQSKLFSNRNSADNDD